MILVAGCVAGEVSTTENIVVNVEMTMEEFLEINGLSFESASQVSDRNNNGEADLFIWDLDDDLEADVVVDLDENISEGSHGITLGFNRILIYDYVKKEVWVAEVGKRSGRIRGVYVEPL
jgi:hypothetical protein